MNQQLPTTLERAREQDSSKPAYGYPGSTEPLTGTDDETETDKDTGTEQELEVPGGDEMIETLPIDIGSVEGDAEGDGLAAIQEQLANALLVFEERMAMEQEIVNTQTYIVRCLVRFVKTWNTNILKAQADRLKESLETISTLISGDPYTKRAAEVIKLDPGQRVTRFAPNIGGVVVHQLEFFVLENDLEFWKKRYQKLLGVDFVKDKEYELKADYKVKVGYKRRVIFKCHCSEKKKQTLTPAVEQGQPSKKRRRVQAVSIKQGCRAKLGCVLQERAIPNDSPVNVWRIRYDCQHSHSLAKDGGIGTQYCHPLEERMPGRLQAHRQLEKLRHYEFLLNKHQCICFSVHIQCGPIRDMPTILETFLEEYIPSDKTHERDEVGYSTKMIRDEDFAYDIRDTLREDKGPVKEVIKSYRCSSCRCPVRNLRDLIKFGRKTYKRDVKFQHDKLDLWLKALSSEAPLVFCEILGDTDPQEDLGRILEQALVDSPASDDNVDRIRHIDMMESERVRVIAMKDQLREAREINELRYRDHHCLVQGCGIEAALERIRKAYRLSKKEVKLFDQKLYLWKYEFGV
ncbi:MAG: hypothetical protein J3Q66DRAFT_369050 [Benniella sp.]|nr:MAG: hypothetical protein J3Q66DRAFT_369050 [Benniella sp.]